MSSCGEVFDWQHFIMGECPCFGRFFLLHDTKCVGEGRKERGEGHADGKVEEKNLQLNLFSNALSAELMTKLFQKSTSRNVLSQELS